MWWFWFLSLLSAVSTSLVGVSYGCITSEREALLQFKLNIQDPNSTLNSWSGLDCCSWKGISCSNNSTGHVIKLNLSNFGSNPGLKGEIDPSLCQLKHLQQLDLSYNSFSGQIPVFFGCFQELTYLDLFFAEFSGTVPPQLGNLTKLQTLDLKCLPFSSGLVIYDAEWLKQLTSLRYLDMSEIDLQNSTNLFQSLSMLPSLSILGCSYCGIRSLPQSLPFTNTTLSSLTKLVLGYNNFVETLLPEWLFQLSNLQYLDISSAGLSGTIPMSLGTLSSLEILRLSNNRLIGPIPDVFGGIPLLNELDISLNNLFESIPTSLGRLSSLESLDLSENNLNGTLTMLSGGLLSLKRLDLSSNSFSGSISTSLGTISSLQSLDLSLNKLNGSIPESLCSLPLIQLLYLSSNYGLTGAIPECIGQLKELRYLDLSNTSLDGVISESHFSNLTKLETLTISSSRSLVMEVPSNWNPPFNLSGLMLHSCIIRSGFPTWIRTQTSLGYLSLVDDEIHGNLPAWIWDSKLMYLNLSNNNLNGGLPGPTYRPFFIAIDFSFNRFQGNISSSFCLSGMLVETMDLSGNELSGEFPICLLNVPFLNLASNNLSGIIPNSSTSQCSLHSLHLENNNLSGFFPSSLKNCTKMVVLDVSRNELNGNIPTWLGESMPSMKILKMRGNKFSGSIPSELSRLSLLQILDLAENKLSGKIPHTFGNFTAMQSIYMSTNVSSFRGSTYQESIPITLKGREFVYNTLLPLVISIDVSSNQLSGEIPSQLGSLIALKNLNLSRNLLDGRIPGMISGLKNIESLDLSRNFLSGEIPPSMTSMTSLSFLDLSYNNLSGRIPSDDQWFSFTEEYFEGNADLCGPPLKKMCEAKQTPITTTSIDTYEKLYARERLWVYLSGVFGFVVGFWTFYGTLFFKKKWRYAYFSFLGDNNFMLYVRFKLMMRRVLK